MEFYEGAAERVMTAEISIFRLALSCSHFHTLKCMGAADIIS